MITDTRLNAMRTLNTVVVIFLLTAIPLEAHAYIDPVTGSLIIQGLIAGVAAVMAGVRSIRERIIALFTRKPIPPQDED